MGGIKGAALSVGRFAQMADCIIDGIPDKFLRNLNGGINITEECKKDRDCYIMGEYIADGMLGSVIMIYYGSFAALLEDKGVDEWESELRETILHELRHHVEIMAGVDYLSEEEQAEQE